MRELPPADLEWIPRAPQVVKVSARLAAPPARVFAAFADAEGWPRWFPLMTEARYVDPAGGGVGRERVVKLRTLGTFRERFLAWDEPGRFAFTVIATSSPMLARFAEDYRLTADGTGTRFDWTLGVELRGVAKLGAPALRAIMRRLVRRGARRLDARLGASPGPL